jgi:hypothetical protein
VLSVLVPQNKLNKIFTSDTATLALAKASKAVGRNFILGISRKSPQEWYCCGLARLAKGPSIHSHDSTVSSTYGIPVQYEN